MEEQTAHTMKKIKHNIRERILRLLNYVGSILLICAAIIRGFISNEFPERWFYYVFFAALVSFLISLILEDLKKEDLAAKIRKVSNILFVFSVFSNFMQRMLYTIVEYFMA